ncbi:MAG TPA: TIGR03435 family protein [Candidatus Sulfotelmatobacter sp.]|jgi:uncharacterized protein (TIGR03435 family)|nr:TIGR03435 family protein [Candidatus Sulfotelmatobacter sp.]
MRTLILLFILLSGLVWEQSTPAFEVVSIKLAKSEASATGNFGCTGGPHSSDPGRITCNSTPIGALIAMAYGIAGNRLAGLKPPYPRFDIIAKVPDGATWDDVYEMWRNVLMDRFKLQVHREKRRMPIYLMVVAKGGVKVKHARDEANTDDSSALVPQLARLDRDGFPIAPSGSSVTSFRKNTAYFSASKITMEQFASDMESRLSIQQGLNMPVIDGTNLNGKYDFRLMWEVRRDSPDTEFAMFSALEDQLGLKLSRTDSQVEILVVDHVDKLPSEN